MTSVPDRARVRLPGISSRAYEHPADRSALVALRKLTGFDALLRRLASLFSDRSLRLMFLASSVRASTEQFPDLYQLLLDGSAILDLPEVPELFIQQDPMPNAMTLGSDKPFIVITTGLLNLLDAEEHRYVIGHELGPRAVRARGVPDHAVPPDPAGHPAGLVRHRLHRPAGDHRRAGGVVPQVRAVL